MEVYETGKFLGVVPKSQENNNFPASESCGHDGQFVNNWVCWCKSSRRQSWINIPTTSANAYNFFEYGYVLLHNFLCVFVVYAIIGTSFVWWFWRAKNSLLIKYFMNESRSFNKSCLTNALPHNSRVTRKYCVDVYHL